MTPIIKVKDDVLKGLNNLGVHYEVVEGSKGGSSDFIHVPTINLYVAKERSHLGKDWVNSHKLLQAENSKMLTPLDFIEFLKYLRSSKDTAHQKIYAEITERRSPWRAEWLDADFKERGGDLLVNYNHVLLNEQLIPQSSEVLNKDTLMKDKTPGISLEDWINSSHTNQGLPSKKVKSGDLYYWFPRSDNNSVARFYAGSVRVGLSCVRNPSLRDSDLGVRAAKQQL